MLRLAAITLGVAIVLAGCVTPDTDTGQVSEEDCLLGGPPREPPGDREIFVLTDEHLSDHPYLQSIFNSSGGTVEVPCDEGEGLMRHLEAEDADVRGTERPYTYDVPLRHGNVTVLVGLRIQVAGP